MYLCYIDESGTSAIPGNTSHFVLAGICLPIWNWKDADQSVTTILDRYDLKDQEIHTAWMLRKYLEQSKIQNFEKMDWTQRRAAVARVRNAELLQLQRGRKQKNYRQTKKSYAHTDAYIHLTLPERLAVVRDVADCFSTWGFARLFAECINKVHFDPAKTGKGIDEQAFEQVVSRYQQFLAKTKAAGEHKNLGLLVHDNNDSVARKHTELMRSFHDKGTLWTKIDRIIETPLFVDSKLTRMVQVADLAAYALRRFVENQETDLFDRVFKRADKAGAKIVSVRHFAGLACKCTICQAHHHVK